MKKIIRKVFLAILSFAFLFGPVFAVNAINVTNPGNAFANADFNTILGNVVNFITGFIAVLGIIFLVWGGLLYVTAAGDDNQMDRAKTTITYAILGLFVAGLAYAVTKLVINKIINGEP